jgi:hypothetical protein
VSDPFLQDVLSAYQQPAQADPFAAGAAAAGIGPGLPPPQTPAIPMPPPGGSSTAPLASMPEPTASVQPPINLDQTTGAPLPPPAPPAGPPNVNAPAGPPPPPEDTSAHGEFPLTMVGGGGVTPAHEVETRGPTLLGQQGVANEAAHQAVSANTQNTENVAQREYEQALAQERQARLREAAMQQSIAERDQEMSDRQADFDNSVKSLSQMAVDPNRFWATRSTGQKIASFVSMTLGGFLQGARGGSNPGMDAINVAIDRDVQAQMSAYQAARDTVNAKQTAFGLAMSKYQNADAARAMARAAALDTVQAQLGQNAALWKDTEAANRANSAIASLEDLKAQQIAQGIRFILPQAGGRLWRDRDGITYNEAQARELQKELRAHDQARSLVGLNAAADMKKDDRHAALQMAIEERKGQAERPAKANEEVAKIAQMLQTAGIPQAKQAATTAQMALAKSPGDYSERAARAVLPGVAQEALLDPDANAREQAWQDFANQAMKATMGNVVAAEELRANIALGNKSQSARKRAIENTLKILNNEEDNAMASATPEVQARYRAQKAAATSSRKDAGKMPGSTSYHGDK